MATSTRARTPPCHPERSEGSKNVLGKGLSRSLAALGMTGAGWMRWTRLGTARVARCSPLILLAALYLAFSAYQSTTADLRLPPPLPEPYGWLTSELLRWLFPVAV